MQTNQKVEKNQKKEIQRKKKFPQIVMMRKIQKETKEKKNGIIDIKLTQEEIKIN